MNTAREAKIDLPPLPEHEQPYCLHCKHIFRTYAERSDEPAEYACALKKHGVRCYAHCECWEEAD